MLVESVVEKAVTPNAHPRPLPGAAEALETVSEELKARQIVVATQAEAEQVKKLLAAGASFEALAMERSADTATRFSGGDIGGYFTLDVMPEPYVAALKDAQPGGLVGPFAVEGGWALVKVEEKRQEAPITFEAARPQIVRFLTYDKVRDLLEKLRAAARVRAAARPRPQEVPGAPREPASGARPDGDGGPGPRRRCGARASAGDVGDRTGRQARRPPRLRRRNDPAALQTQDRRRQADSGPRARSRRQARRDGRQRGAAGPRPAGLGDQARHRPGGRRRPPSRTAAPTAAPGKPGLAVSPLADALPEDAARRRRPDRHRPGRLLQA
jgi:hypothetical protein